MSGIKYIGQVARYKPLAQCGMEELAVRQFTLKPSGGVAFTRTTDREQKDAARQLVLDLFNRHNWPDNLRMLTMPGLHWRFERLLLAQREPGWMQRTNSRRTYFLGFENDRSIYFAAVTQMPGLQAPNSTVKTTRTKFAEMAVNTHFGTFFFANVDDVLPNRWERVDAAWLDYTGPLSIERIKLIEDFYCNSAVQTLVVTAMKARWNTQTVTAIDSAGGHSEWLRKHLPGEVLHDIEYQDTVPMAQFAVRRG